MRQRLFGKEPHYGVEMWRVWSQLPLMMTIGALVGWLFYASIWASIIGALLSIASVKVLIHDYKTRCDQRLLDEFSDLTLWLIAGFQSGRTLENTLISFVDEWNQNQRRGYIFMGSELRQWKERLLMGHKGTELFKGLAQITRVDMLIGFSNLLQSSLDHGGSSIDVIQRFYQYLREERLLAKEVEVVVAQKRLEHLLVSMAPLGFLFYLQSTTPSFIAPLYETLLGRLLMSFALIVFLTMWLWGKKLIKCWG